MMPNFTAPVLSGRPPEGTYRLVSFLSRASYRVKRQTPTSIAAEGALRRRHAGVQAAVHGQRHARYERRAVRGQERHGVRYLLRLAHAADGMGGRHPLPYLLRV